MRLLILTQAVDRDDPTLGFFHSWIIELAAHFDSLIVVCLKEGTHALPANVRVLSLGKEADPSRTKYIARLFRYVWKERKNYDAVFVHQNQEYILLAGILWKMLGKNIFMWRNHYAGSLLTSFAGMLCTKVFYTSEYSYTASFKNAIQMPVGVETDVFKPRDTRVAHSVLFLGRIAPSKHPDTLIEALGLLSARGIDFTASFYGPTLAKDEPYRAALSRRIRELGLASKVSLHDGVSHHETPKLYASHEIFVNLSGSGMYDKTLFEAAASGCIVVAASKDFAKHTDGKFTFVESDVESLFRTLEKALALSPDERADVSSHLRIFAEGQSLSALTSKLETLI